MLNFVDWSVVNDVSKDRYAFIFKTWRPEDEKV